MSMKKLLLVALVGLIVLNSEVIMAQDPGDLLKGSVKDANYLMEGYAGPLLKTFGAGFNNGWYNTAKTHKKFGVDLTFSVAAVGIPSSDKFFTVNNDRLSSIQLTADHNGNSVTTSGKVPTIIGPGTTQSQFQYQAPLTGVIDGVGGELDLGDLPMSRIPIPMLNLGFGLPKNTDVKFRFIPSVGTDEAKFSLFGVGVMHDVKQYIPGIKLLPFDLSAFVGYTRMNLNAEIDGNDPSKKGEFSVNATTIQAVVSKKVSVLTVYGGFGYNLAKTNLVAKGYYDLNGIAGDGPNGSDEEAKNPVNLDLSNNGPRATAGLRLKLAVFTFHGDYTFQKYSTFTAGFGISVR
jgi:hypothetical protein